MVRQRRFLPALPVLTLAAMLVPVAAGLFWVVLPAFGHLPAAGLVGPSLAPFHTLIEQPGIGASSTLSLTTGILATAGALAITFLILAGWSGTRAFAMLQRLLSPLLAVPHAAAAFGLAFLVAPSGWIMRTVSPGLSGFERPPDWLILQDPLGLSLVAGLIAKEVPFLLLMALAALPQTQPQQSRQIAAALGYGRVTGFLKTVAPRLYAQIRLPVYVTLAYSMSTVDVALILGPTTPPTLAVQIVKWMGDPDLSMRLMAASGALLQLGLVALGLAIWRIGEAAVRRLGYRWIASGARGRLDGPVRGLGFGLGALSAIAVLAGIAGIALWSVAARWSFPDAVPDGLTLRSWMRHGPGALDALATTASVAGAATLGALVLTIGCLEAEARYGLRQGRATTWVLYLPLLVPQVAFLPGLQTLMLSAGLASGLGPVILAHLVFVLPYVFLSLADPFRSWDGRQGRVAAALGASPDRVLWSVRLPMLLRPVLTAAAVGLAVSVGQYLPTLLIGGGRVATLTTEAVALTSGGDRRAIGVMALMQTLAALVPFAVALAIPAVIWRNRRGLAHA